MPSDRATLTKEAVHDWKTKRARPLQLHEFATLKADLDKGLADLAAGKTTEFDLPKIMERGRKLLATRSLSA